MKIVFFLANVIFSLNIKSLDIRSLITQLIIYFTETSLNINKMRLFQIVAEFYSGSVVTSF